ncbi:MAG: hypothetical protein QF682_03580 [Candidatus Thermoplasmatota archaeon]|nr:hypothetical protein [Candidatus Thermoplasmatota archaeon]
MSEANDGIGIFRASLYFSGLIKIGTAIFGTSNPTGTDIYLFSVLVPTAIIVTILMSMNIALVAYSIKNRCKCREGGALGVVGMVISMITCCSPIAVSIIGMSSAMLLAPFVGLTSLFGILLLLGAMVLNTRHIQRLQLKY